jgi:alkylation response protein AidB-like acyl-CoA dehydrogenase
MELYRELYVDLPAECELLRDGVHRFAAEVMRPAGAALDRIADPREVVAADSPLWTAMRAAYGLGYHTVGISTEFGGLALRGLARHVVLEELGWGSAGLATAIAVAGFPFSALTACGDAELIREFVDPFVADKECRYIGCWAISEPAHGSDELAVRSKEFYDAGIRGQVVARPDGEYYVINGQKAAWVSNGSIATHALTYLTMEGSIGMSGGAVAFVPLDLPGVGRGASFDKLGQRDLNQGEIFFENVRLPRRMVLVGPATYELTLTRTLTAGTAAIAAILTGVARAAYEEALAYTTQRVQGGRPISQHQLVQRRLFDMFSKVEAARALSRATMIYNHASPTPSLENGIAAKTFCTQIAFEVANDAIELCGATGLGKHSLVEKLFRDARMALVEEGTNEVLSLVGAQHLISRTPSS